MSARRMLMPWISTSREPEHERRRSSHLSYPWQNVRDHSPTDDRRHAAGERRHPRRRARRPTCAALLVFLAGTSCGSNATVPLGDVCSSPKSCVSAVCLYLAPNDQNTPGICSSFCATSADCAAGAVCTAEANTGANVCFRTCTAAADCAEGVPCIWSPTLGEGICSTIPSSFCSQLTMLEGCSACVATNCCAEIKACAEDLACGKLEAQCSGNAACQTNLQASSDMAAELAGSCVATACETACP
jgi:hypothetical protein